MRGGDARSEWCGAGRCTPDPLAASRSFHVHRSMKRGSSLGARALHPCAAFYRKIACMLVSVGWYRDFPIGVATLVSVGKLIVGKSSRRVRSSADSGQAGCTAVRHSAVLPHIRGGNASRSIRVIPLPFRRNSARYRRAFLISCTHLVQTAPVVLNQLM